MQKTIAEKFEELFTLELSNVTIKIIYQRLLFSSHIGSERKKKRLWKQIVLSLFERIRYIFRGQAIFSSIINTKQKEAIALF